MENPISQALIFDKKLSYHLAIKLITSKTSFPREIECPPRQKAGDIVELEYVLDALFGWNLESPPLDWVCPGWGHREGQSAAFFPSICGRCSIEMPRTGVTPFHPPSVVLHS